jgi:hypothetical protein
MKKFSTITYLVPIGIIGIVIASWSFNLYKDKVAFDQAKTKNSEIAYVNYIKNYPEGMFVEEARNQAEKIVFKNASKDNSNASYTKFLKSYPDGYFVGEAVKRLINNLTNEAKQLEKKLLWKEAINRWQQIYRLIKSPEILTPIALLREIAVRIETCQYNMNHPVKYPYLEEISRKSVGFLGWSKTNIYSLGTYRTYSHCIITYNIEVKSISAKPIRSIVVQLVSKLDHEDLEGYSIEILKGKVLYPGKTIKTKFQIKVEEGTTYASDAEVIKVDGKKIYR